MSTTVEVRGVTCTWDGTAVSFICEGAPIPSKPWNGPDADRPTKQTFFMGEPYDDNGFSSAVDEEFRRELGIIPAA
jgi:hypothetical protein